MEKAGVPSAESIPLDGMAKEESMVEEMVDSSKEILLKIEKEKGRSLRNEDRPVGLIKAWQLK